MVADASVLDGVHSLHIGWSKRVILVGSSGSIVGRLASDPVGWNDVLLMKEFMFGAQITMSSTSSSHGADERPMEEVSNIPSLMVAFMAALTTGGATYGFSIYGDDLKHSLHLSQAQLDTISTSFFFAGMFSWIPGICADKFGTRFSLSLGGVTGATSCALFWMVARAFLEIPPPEIVATLSFIGICIFLSCALITGSVFKIIVACCGTGSKGSAVGVAKGYVGLGAGVYSCLFQSIRKPEQSSLDFLPMAGFFFLACATLPALNLLPSANELKDSVTLRDDSTPNHFRVLYLSLVALGVVAVGNSLLGLRHYDSASDPASSPPSSGGSFFTAMFLVATWLLPILSLRYVPPRRVDITLDSSLDDEMSSASGDLKVETSIRGLEMQDDPLATDQESRNEIVKLLDGADASARSVDDASAALVRESSPSRVAVVELNLVQMLKTPNAWLMLWTSTILVGAGIVETNNMAQMTESLGFPSSVTPASITLFSVAQAAARVMTGSVSEAALDWNTRSCCIDRGVPRPFFLLVASILGFLAHFSLGVARDEIPFVVGATLSGAAFGMVWPLMVLIAGEVFGPANVGANYMFFDGFTSAIGSLLLSNFVAGEVYESHINENAADKTTCYGMSCFRETHMVVAALSLTCALTSLAMMYTSREVYGRSSQHAE